MKQCISPSLGELYFRDIRLGDLRRNRRLAKVFDMMVRHPGGTLPAKLVDPADLRAFYRLMDADEVTHESVMKGHFAATSKAIQEARAQQATVLRIHDATELDYSKIGALQEHLGQIGQGTHRGYICHNSLAVRADTRAVLGLTSQILHRRADVPKDETDAQRRKRANRESRLWVRGAQESGPAPEGEGGLVVDVSDSLSDTYEYMYFEIQNGRHFLLRSREDRKLHIPINGHESLYAGVRSWRCKHSYEISLRATAESPARQATVNLSFGRVTLHPPGKRHGDYENVPLSMWAVRVWEPKPPKGLEPVEWILLTSVQVESVEQACTRVEWYECRFIIEDYHKGMKMGCGIETMQFDTVERLEPALGILSILATTLLKLRDAARQPDADTRPATDVVDATYVAVLCQHYPKRLKTKNAVTVKQFFMHVARLGGHQNRKRDGFPGWITLWRGWMTLESMVQGYRLAERRQKKCG